MAKTRRPGRRAAARGLPASRGASAGRGSPGGGGRPARPGAGGVTAEAFPHVAAFVRGYLHEDVAQEYGSAIEARDTYLGDCSPSERRAFVEESRRLARALSELALPEATRVLVEVLGSAWRPVTRLDIEDVFAVPGDRA